MRLAYNKSFDSNECERANIKAKSTSDMRDDFEPGLLLLLHLPKPLELKNLSLDLSLDPQHLDKIESRMTFRIRALSEGKDVLRFGTSKLTF